MLPLKVSNSRPEFASNRCLPKLLIADCVPGSPFAMYSPSLFLIVFDRMGYQIHVTHCWIFSHSFLYISRLCILFMLN